MDRESYGDAIKQTLLNKEVEIYCGDTGQTQQSFDFDSPQKSVIKGAIVEVIGDCIIVKCVRDGKVNDVYINSWSITAIVPKGSVSLKDIFVNEEERAKKR